MTDDTTTQRANRRATLSMGLGLGSLMCSCFTGIPAVLLGVMSLSGVAQDHRIRAYVGIGSGGLMTMMLPVFMVLAPPPAERSAAGASPAVGSSAGAAVQAPSGPAMPADQAAFCEVVEQHTRAYRSASNDLKKSAVRGQRRAAMNDVLGSGKVKGWVGYAKQLTTNGDGKAVFAVALPCGASVGTWNNALSDIMSDTLIAQNSALFGVLAELDAGSWGKKGSAVRFSGSFEDADGPDAFREKSLTELGAMTDPEFVFRFASVEPL